MATPVVQVPAKHLLELTDFWIKNGLDFRSCCYVHRLWIVSDWHLQLMKKADALPQEIDEPCGGLCLHFGLILLLQN